MDYVVVRKMGRPRMAGPLAHTRATAGAAPATAGMAAPAELRVEAVSVSPGQLRDIARDPEVAAIAPRIPTRLLKPLDSQAEADAAVAVNWGIGAIGADKSAFDGAGIRVAVLDTGIDAAHVAFNGVTLTEEDFTGTGRGDDNGHGTHCAGTIFGRDVGGIRIGVARGVKEALIGKVLDAEGGGDSLMLFNGIQWAVRNQARVISMSIGFDFPGFVKYLIEQEGYPIAQATSAALQAFMANLRAFDSIMDFVESQESFGPGTIVVAASGNESQHPGMPIHCSLPAAADGVVSVGAIGSAGGTLNLAPFSNISCELVAPGMNVLSAKAGGGLVAFQGTSMACPHVAGVAALWWQAINASQLPKRASTVLAKLIANARVQGLNSFDPSSHGNGLVQAP